MENIHVMTFQEENVDTLGKKINGFLECNPQFEIIDIKYSSAIAFNSSTDPFTGIISDYSALIIYKGDFY